VGRVVGADREVGAGGSEQPRRLEHDAGDAGVVAGIERRHPLRHRDRVERDAGVIVLADDSEGLAANGLVAERGPFGAAGDDADVLHDASLYGPDPNESGGRDVLSE
jgi:hypothetical protein